MGSEWQRLSWRPSPGPWLPPPLCAAQRSRDSLAPALQLRPGLLPLGTLPSSPAGQAPKRGDGSRHPPTHGRACGPSSWAGERSVGSPPRLPHPVGPSGFPRFPRRPRGTAGPSPKHSHHHSVGQLAGTGQSSRALSHPQARPPGVHLGEAPSWTPKGPKVMRCTLVPQSARRQEGRQDHRPDSMPRPALSFTRVTSFRQRPPNTEGHILIPILSTKRSERGGRGRHSSSDPC